MVRPDRPGFDTLAVHAGENPDPRTGARVTPVYRTASFVFPDGDHAAALFDLAVPGHIYSRISNPTVAVFEERIAALEGGVGAVATASGQAALHLTIATLVGAGGHLACSRAVYGGTANLLIHTLPRFGITTDFFDPEDPDDLAAVITDDTRLVIAETIGNPAMIVLDIPAVARVAHEAGVPLLVDNTFATPVLCRPLEWGADLVLHSATKFISGHGGVIGGVVVDGGRFDWGSSDRFPTLTEPYDGYHGIDYLDEFGPTAFAARARTEGLRDFGAVMAADVAALLTQGLATLPVRMRRHVENARTVVAFLREADGVTWVAHPETATGDAGSRAERMLPDGGGSILSFGIDGGRPAGERFMAGLEVFSHLANVGDVRSLVIHPASTTHRQLSADELAAAGIGEDMIRLSVGLEDPDDLVSDLRRGLSAARRG